MFTWLALAMTPTFHLHAGVKAAILSGIGERKEWVLCSLGLTCEFKASYFHTARDVALPWNTASCQQTYQDCIKSKLLVGSANIFLSRVLRDSFSCVFNVKLAVRLHINFLL